jgi:hypothetical protein
MGDIYHYALDFFTGVVLKITGLAQAYSRAFSYINSATNDLEEFKINWFAM